MARFLLVAALFAAMFGARAEEGKISAGSVVVLPVDGMVSQAQFFFLRRALKDSESAGAAAIMLDMDTPGGDLKATEKIVQMLTKSPVPAYTYVNTNAGSAGALIALSTKKVFMAPISAIGAAAPVAGSGQEIPETMNAKIVSYFSGYFRSGKKSCRPLRSRASFPRPHCENRRPPHRRGSRFAHPQTRPGGLFEIGRVGQGIL